MRHLSRRILTPSLVVAVVALAVVLEGTAGTSQATVAPPYRVGARARLAAATPAVVGKAYFHYDQGPQVLRVSKIGTTITTLTLPPGSYLVSAKLVLRTSKKPAAVSCSLSTVSITADDVADGYVTGAGTTLAMQSSYRLSAPTKIHLGCAGYGPATYAEYVAISAIAVGRVVLSST